MNNAIQSQSGELETNGLAGGRTGEESCYCKLERHSGAERSDTVGVLLESIEPDSEQRRREDTLTETELCPRSRRSRGGHGEEANVGGAWTWARLRPSGAGTTRRDFASGRRAARSGTRASMAAKCTV